MEKGIKSFLGWAGIVLGSLVFLVGIQSVAASVGGGQWANYMLGILMLVQGVWLLAAKG